MLWRLAAALSENPVRLLAGLLALLLIAGTLLHIAPVRLYPAVPDRIILASIHTPGLPPAANWVAVTRPAQNALREVEGIRFITSASRLGTAELTIGILPSYDPAEIRQEIRERLRLIRHLLPESTEEPIVDFQHTAGVGMIAMISIEGAGTDIDRHQMTHFVEDQIIPAVNRVEGIGRLELFGLKPEAIRLRIDPAKVIPLGISQQNIADLIQAQTKLPLSTSVNIGDLSVELQPGNSDDLLPRLLATPIRKVDGKTIRLRDVLTAVIADEKNDYQLTLDDRPAMVVAAYASKFGNPITAGNQIKAAVADINRIGNKNFKIGLIYDFSLVVKKAIANVLQIALEAIVIVSAVVWFCLRNAKSAFLCTLAVPLSIGLSIPILLAADLSINLLTLTAMIIAVGLVVDDAIIIVEAITKQRELGKTIDEAVNIALTSAAPSVTMLTLAVIVVILPLGLIAAPVGPLMREFSITLVVALVASYIVALFIIPALYILISPGATTHTAGYQSSSRIESIIKPVLKKPIAAFVLVSLTSAAICAAAISGRSELAPPEDDGVVYVSGTTQPGMSLAGVANSTRSLRRMLTDIPERAYSFFAVGVPTHSDFFAMLMLKDKRKRSSYEIQQTLLSQFSTATNVAALAYSVPSVPGVNAGYPIEIAITAPGALEQLMQSVNAAAQKLASEGTIAAWDLLPKNDRLETRVNIDSDALTERGYSDAEVRNLLNWYNNDTEIAKIPTGRRYVKVIPEFKANDASLRDNIAPILAVAGSHSDISPYVTLSTGFAVSSLYQHQHQDAILIKMAPAAGVSMSKALGQSLAQLKEALPQGTHLELLGESADYAVQRKSIMYCGIISFGLLLLTLTLYSGRCTLALMMVLCSFPVVALTLLPVSVGLISLNIYSAISLVAIVGLLAKHIILVTEGAVAFQRMGFSADEAVLAGLRNRWRPMWMTTFAMLCGSLPLLVGTGYGQNARYSLGITLSIGVVLGTVALVLWMPSAYLIAEKVGKPFNIRRVERA